MKKPQSMPIFDDVDFPISLVSKSIFQGIGCAIWMSFKTNP